MTTASSVPGPFGAALNTWASSDWPATGCRTFGVEDRMRVPSPAASTMVRLVLPVILIRNVSWRGLRRRRHKGFSTGEETIRQRKSGQTQDPARFPDNV